MVVFGHVRNGMIVLDDPLALPEGTPVSVLIAPASAPPNLPAPESIWSAFAEVRSGIPADALARLPVDGAEQHDRYIGIPATGSP